MFTIGKITNRYVINASSFLMIGLIGMIDYYTGPEFSFSIFYILPIAGLAIYRNTRHVSLLINSLFASAVWFMAEYYSRDYSHIVFPLWNAFMRFVIFFSFGLLLLYLKIKQFNLLAANINLTTLNEEKNLIIGTAAHDLRNSVGGIYSYSRIILDEHKHNLPPDVVEAIEYLHSVSSSTLDALTELLDISKIESGKVLLSKERHNYIKFIKHHIALYKLIANNKNIRIHLSIFTDDFCFLFDKNYLGEVIDNLLSNAIKYSDPDSEVTVRVSLKDDHHVLTEVIDQGEGIQRNEQNKLFNYYQTTSTQPTAGETSTGLGLAIAKKIVTLHQGEIGLRSIPDQGSTFFYTLPVE
ncbi:MAG: HAMP domain-containing sensor histidine kinase [Bacteroidales bacterium]